MKFNDVIEALKTTFSRRSGAAEPPGKNVYCNLELHML